MTDSAPSLSNRHDSGLFGGLEGFCDVTELFRTATSELRVGQLLTAEHFRLTDGMMALEIMDPKMDSGMALPLGGADRLPADFVKGLILAPPEVLGIMDMMLSQEVGIKLP